MFIIHKACLRAEGKYFEPDMSKFTNQCTFLISYFPTCFGVKSHHHQGVFIVTSTECPYGSQQFEFRGPYVHCWKNSSHSSAYKRYITPTLDND
jgi:hypothetical protein